MTCNPRSTNIFKPSGEGIKRWNRAGSTLEKHYFAVQKSTAKTKRAGPADRSLARFEGETG
jgi:hypothetical protein